MGQNGPKNHCEKYLGVFSSYHIMITNDNFRKPQKTPKYSCKKCDFFSSNKKDFNRHLSTDKHKMITNDNKMITKKPQKTPKLHYCPCGKKYKYASNLSRHKKSCTKKPQIDDVEEKKEKKEDKMDTLLELLMNQQETINSVIKKVGNTTTNSHNTNNITFQLFLDKNCKNAVCLEDFTKNLTLSIEDLLNQKQLGFAGVGNIVVKNLTDMKLEDRPIHCTDVKNSKYYIKNNEGWEEDNGTSIEKVLTTAKGEATKALSKIWNEEYGENWAKDEKLSMAYIETVKAVTNEPSSREKLKAIKNVGSSVLVKVKKLLDEFE